MLVPFICFSKDLFSVCMCVCMYVWTCACVCVLSLSEYSFETGSLPEPEAHLFSTKLEASKPSHCLLSLPSPGWGNGRWDARLLWWVLGFTLRATLSCSKCTQDSGHVSSPPSIYFNVFVPSTFESLKWTGYCILSHKTFMYYISAFKIGVQNVTAPATAPSSGGV